MSFPDGEQLGAKILTSCIHYASYMASNPAATENQLKLANIWRDGPGMTSTYLTVLGQLSGLNDASAYSAVDAWVNAREAEVIKLFVS